MNKMNIMHFKLKACHLCDFKFINCCNRLGKNWLTSFFFSSSVLLELWPQSQRDVQRMQRRPLLRVLLPAQRLGKTSPHLQPGTSSSTQARLRHHRKQGGCHGDGSGSRNVSRRPQSLRRRASLLQSRRRAQSSRFSLDHSLHSRIRPRDQRTLGGGELHLFSVFMDGAERGGNDLWAKLG